MTPDCSTASVRPIHEVSKKDDLAGIIAIDAVHLRQLHPNAKARQS
jgi:hypothetical protein